MAARYLHTLCSAVLLTACIPAAAIEITSVDTSPERVIVTVTWPTVPGIDDYDSFSVSGLGVAESADFLGFFSDPVVYWTSSGSPVLWGAFDSPGEARTFPDMTWNLFGSAVQVLPLAHTEYGGIFVFGSPIPTPDSNSSLVLLGLSLGGFLLARRPVVK